MCKGFAFLPKSIAHQLIAVFRSQLCINTGIVFLRKFYAVHPLAFFDHMAMSKSCLYLATKVENQLRLPEHVMDAALAVSVRQLSPEDFESEFDEMIWHENFLLKTLGFEVTVEHPHIHVISICAAIKSPKDVLRAAYFLASNT